MNHSWPTYREPVRLKASRPWLRFRRVMGAYLLPEMIISWLARERRERPRRMRRQIQCKPFRLAEILPWNYSQQRCKLRRKLRRIGAGIVGSRR